MNADAIRKGWQDWFARGALRALLPPDFPTVVCLCGSTRFYDAFQAANYRETMAGRVVLSVGFYPHCSERAHGQAVGYTDGQKAALDELHLRKVDLCDEILVVSEGGYFGTSTRHEIDYAAGLGKKVRWVEQTAKEHYDALAKG